MIREYSGFFTFATQNAATLTQIKQAAVESGIEINLSPSTLEIDYQGRDHQRKIVQFLAKVASFLHKAEGEMECWTTDGENQPTLEYFTMKQDAVFRQPCRIIRLPEECVSVSGDDAGSDG